MDQEEYITQKEYAKIHNVSVDSVYKQVSRGLLPTSGYGKHKLVKKSAPFIKIKGGGFTQKKAERVRCVISICSLDICCHQCEYKTSCKDMCLNSPEKCGCSYKNINI